MRALKTTVHPSVVPSVVPPVESDAPVLVIDDQLPDALGSERTLTAAGYEVKRESDGDAALQSVRASLIRVVVSELYVRCAESRCVVAALKENRRRLPRLRVVVYTRHTAAVDLEWALAAGADAVVFKSAPDRVLLREVRWALGAVA